MLLLLSPAKAMDSSSIYKGDASIPKFIEESKIAIQRLQKLSLEQIKELMGISAALSSLNYSRFQNMDMGKQVYESQKLQVAIFAFKGDVYRALDIQDFSQEDIFFAQKHIRILSGLYGMLKPLDRIQEYRLEMSTKIDLGTHKNLYEFWGKKIIDAIEKELANQSKKVIVNLASKEYFKVLPLKDICSPVITPVFKQYKNGNYKVIGVVAKRARGLMARYIIKNRIKDIEDIKQFSWGGYLFNPTLSTPEKWVFCRE